MEVADARFIMRNIRDYGLTDDEEIEAVDLILTREEEFSKQMDLDYIDENYVPKEKYSGLKEENERLRDLYWRTARRLSENGKVELADYMLAQINAVPTFVPM